MKSQHFDQACNASSLMPPVVWSRPAPVFYPEVRRQRSVVHLYRYVFSRAPTNTIAEVARMLKAIHAGKDANSAMAKNAEVVMMLKAMTLNQGSERS